MMAAMRGVKAEGGWGVVCTEYCSIHPGSDNMPFPHASLWGDDDVRNLRLMTDAVHKHGALAGVELWYGGFSTANMYSRELSFGVDSMPSTALVGMPIQSQAMTKTDINTFRGWHTAAAKRAVEAGFDIVYVYATHDYLLSNFLSSRFNTRRDEYGGKPLNRVRLLREVIEDTKAAIGHRCAVAVRYSVPALIDTDPDNLFEMLESIADLPDLWDITVTDYSLEMGSSRFVKEAANQAAVKKVKSLTVKPVVSVGRFTSPDIMLTQITTGVQDFIGAARPSIADPFLPQKINQNRLEDIRECIGCNVCYAHDALGSPIRCTQNPSMGEEWRRGWHPQNIPSRHADESVLVIGSGPAGLEASATLGQRGYRVILAEADKTLGGRISSESRLPGLAEWARVRDWRLGQIGKMPNIDVYPDNCLDASAILDLEMQHVIIATGAEWRSDGVGRWRSDAFDGWNQPNVVSVDQILNGFTPGASVVIYDDDHYYIASAIALKLRAEGAAVKLVTPQGRAAAWSYYTEEQDQTLKALYEADIDIVTDRGLDYYRQNKVGLRCVFSDRESELAADYLIPVTARIPSAALWFELESRADEFQASGGLSMQRIGDCAAPGIIASAVYAGHKAAQELGQDKLDLANIKRDRVIAHQELTK
jgi:dimethylamine/trimethylamine dehydrogenase